MASQAPVGTSLMAPNHHCADQAHPTVRLIASRLPWYTTAFSPHDVPRFFDITGVTEDPVAFQAAIDVLAARYESNKPTSVAGFDARGFILGAPLALALRVPFLLIRKKGKMPGALVSSGTYQTEYSSDETVMRLGSVKPGDSVLLVDDLIATGGTAAAGFDLVHAMGGRVHAFAAMIQLPGLGGVKRLHEHRGGHFKDVPVFTLVDDATIGDDLGRDPPAGVPQVVPADTAMQVAKENGIGARF